MSVFGWSYPPGCSGPPDEGREDVCGVCYAYIDDCVCPECPVCHTHGDSSCYMNSPEGHGMKYTVAQLDSKAAGEAVELAQAERDRAAGDEWRAESHLDELMRDEMHEKGHE